MDFVPNESATKIDRIENDKETSGLLLWYLLARKKFVGGSIVAVGAGQGGALIHIPTTRVMKGTRYINGEGCRVYDASQRRMRRWPTVVVIAEKRWSMAAALELRIDGVDEDDGAAFATEIERGYAMSQPRASLTHSICTLHVSPDPAAVSQRRLGIYRLPSLPYHLPVIGHTPFNTL
ncbi:hypothetical protein L1887_08942 [Cichorium endivia]|nr:hypothetical protein L1887_08942 [Cichorium endivia]